jgi:hypothetical protein
MNLFIFYTYFKYFKFIFLDLQYFMKIVIFIVYSFMIFESSPIFEVIKIYFIRHLSHFPKYF